ncbi:hypothetical protein [Sulfurihydrogenibium sp.]|jgi:hypothetical protein|uniref:hypothetical protein n=1 Tax=Sulfurihydrogenibium sp. TaxID=2053621 RepID=UPI00263395C7|nr:hypothetical protein [Sulfurihydrogenibium sp.]
MMKRNVIYILLFILSAVNSSVFADETLDKVNPVMCGKNTYRPIIVASQDDYPCPGGVYCEHYRCKEAFCCPWGYFYSNPCTCLCYRSSYDAGRDCDTYFRCN